MQLLERKWGKIVVKRKSVKQIRLERTYKELCNTKSDINEHLPTLKKYAEQCNHVTEFDFYFTFLRNPVDIVYSTAKMRYGHLRRNGQTRVEADEYVTWHIDQVLDYGENFFGGYIK